MVMAVGYLRHDDDEGPTFRMSADGVGQTNLGLVHAVGAAFAGAVEEEDDGPGVMRIVLDGQVDDVAVAGAVENDDAVEEAGVLRMDGGALRLFGGEHREVVGRVVWRVSGCAGAGVTDGRCREWCGGLRRKGRGDGECGEQDAGQMKAARHWVKDTVQTGCYGLHRVAETAANFSGARALPEAFFSM